MTDVAFFFFFQAEDGIRDKLVTGVQTCALPILVDIVVALGTGLVLWFGARLVMGNVLSAGELVVFILYLGKMYKPMQEISKMTDTYSKAAVGYRSEERRVGKEGRSQIERECY